jgi:kinesin family protein 15
VSFCYQQVQQREEESQCGKMVLRFRDEKIQRLESLSQGVLEVDTYLAEEKKMLSEELQLLRGRINRNPELTRFAMENIRLLDQIKR